MSCSQLAAAEPGNLSVSPGIGDTLAYDASAFDCCDAIACCDDPAAACCNNEAVYIASIALDNTGLPVGMVVTPSPKPLCGEYRYFVVYNDERWVY